MNTNIHINASSQAPPETFSIGRGGGQVAASIYPCPASRLRWSQALPAESDECFIKVNINLNKPRQPQQHSASAEGKLNRRWGEIWEEASRYQTFKPLSIEKSPKAVQSPNYNDISWSCLSYSYPNTN